MKIYIFYKKCVFQLDEQLTHNLQANIPRHGFPLLSFSSSTSSSGPPSQGRDHSELPTLLHFSAAHGLERLTCALLDCPGARHALTVTNVHGATPVEVGTANILRTLQIFLPVPLPDRA